MTYDLDAINRVAIDDIFAQTMTDIALQAQL